MLIITIYANEERIDTICVQNMGEYKHDHSLRRYKIVSPQGFEDVEILHQRSKGYIPLVEQVMSWLKRRRSGRLENESLRNRETTVVETQRQTQLNLFDSESNGR